eukprot:3428229-Pleurochrysis_carterae.AAC.1
MKGGSGVQRKRRESARQERGAGKGRSAAASGLARRSWTGRAGRKRQDSCAPASRHRRRCRRKSTSGSLRECGPGGGDAGVALHVGMERKENKK